MVAIGYFLLHLEQLSEARDFGRRQVAVGARLEGPELQKTDFDALELLHHQAEMFEHHSDLVLPSLDQADLIPWIFGALDHLQSGGCGHLARERHTVAKLLLLLGGQRSVRLYD